MPTIAKTAEEKRELVAKVDNLVNTEELTVKEACKRAGTRQDFYKKWGGTKKIDIVEVVKKPTTTVDILSPLKTKYPELVAKFLEDVKIIDKQQKQQEEFTKYLEFTKTLTPEQKEQIEEILTA